MQIYCTGILLLCFHFAAGSGHFFQELPEELLAINTAEGLTQHLQNQLVQNETKSLLSWKCFQHVLQYVTSLRKGELWALQMFDASAKVPSGFLRGALGSLGAFDQCLKIKGENERLGTIRGKYCLGEIRIVNMNSIGRTALSLDVRTPGQQRWLNFVEGAFNLPWGICLPDACSAKDFQFLHFLFFLRFTEETCQTQETQIKDFDTADIGAISFFGVIAALMVASTLYDIFIYYAREGQGFAILRAFSVATNTLKIVTIKKEENELSCLHGIRMLSFFIKMAGMRYASYLLGPVQNWLDTANWWLTAGEYIDAVILIDTFFVISGMLISYNYLKDKSEGGKFNLVVFYLNRILRLTPALAAIILVHTTLLRYVGTGPIWAKMRDQYLVDNCREYWWSALLYIQNYINPTVTSICILQSWQLNVDMHLFLLSPLILIPLTRAPKYTLAAVGGLLLCSIVTPFLATWVYDIKAIIFTNTSLYDLRRYVKHFYFPTHTRASAWIIGFVLGYLLHESRKTNRIIHIKKEFRVLLGIALWVVAFGLLTVCILVGRELIGQTYDWFLHALHIAFMRPFWAIGISCIIFACANGLGGPINSFLSLPFFQVLSRISYCTYLVDLTVYFTLTYQTRTPNDFSNLNAWNRIFGDAMFSFALGFLWTLAFESPFVTIVKVLFGRTKRK